MIQEITIPDHANLILLSLPIIVIGAVFSTIYSLERKRTKAIIGVIITIAGSVLLGAVYNDMYAAKEERQIQIDSLPCENLEEAYNIYELEYIKEKYASECVEPKEPWYKR